MEIIDEYQLISETREGIRKLPDGTDVRTKASEHHANCTLQYEVGTTGYKNGDSGHGGRTYIRLEDIACTDMRVRVNGGQELDCDKLEIIFGGDDELEAIVGALKFFSAVLENQTRKTK
jgi:hypothetical protein